MLAEFGAPPWLTIITGHYGAGKTNLALNIALGLRALGHAVTLVDLDIVNPYFRSSDSLPLLHDAGIQLLGPVHAANATNLDTPSLPPGIDETIQLAGRSDVEKAVDAPVAAVAPPTTTTTGDSVGKATVPPPPASPAAHAVIIDVGGEADGARALGRYAGSIAARPHRLLYVANFNRPATASVATACDDLRRIEQSSGLKLTALFGNTHLMEHSSVEGLLAAAEQTRELAALTGLPLLGIGAPYALAEPLRERLPAAGLGELAVYPLRKLVVTPWG
jgi:hypothetical protein